MGNCGQFNYRDVINPNKSYLLLLFLWFSSMEKSELRTVLFRGIKQFVEFGTTNTPQIYWPFTNQKNQHTHVIECYRMSCLCYTMYKSSNTIVNQCLDSMCYSN